MRGRALTPVDIVKMCGWSLEMAHAICFERHEAVRVVVLTVAVTRRVVNAYSRDRVLDCSSQNSDEMNQRRLALFAVV